MINTLLWKMAANTYKLTKAVWPKVHRPLHVHQSYGNSLLWQGTCMSSMQSTLIVGSDCTPLGVLPVGWLL
jgi:hypothetical protein